MKRQQSKRSDKNIVQAKKCKCGHTWLQHKWYRGPNMYCLVNECSCREFEYFKTKMKQNNDLKKLKQKIAKILKNNGIKKAGIFGSYARGEQKKLSDVDILIKTPKKTDLYDFIGIKQELEDALHKRVDLVDYKLIRPEIRDRILQDEVKVI